MVAQAAKSSVVAESVEESIRRHKQARNADYVDYDADKPLEERTLWQRVTRIWSIARPNYVVLKLGALVVFIGVQVALDDLSFGNTGRMYGALTTLDRGLMLRLFRNGVLLAALQAASEESMQYLRLLLGAQVTLEQFSAY